MNTEISLKKISIWSIVSFLLGVFGVTYFLAFSDGSPAYLIATASSAVLAVIIGIISLIAFRKNQSIAGKIIAALGILFGTPTVFFIATVAKFILDLSSGI